MKFAALRSILAPLFPFLLLFLFYEFLPTYPIWPLTEGFVERLLLTGPIGSYLLLRGFTYPRKLKTRLGPLILCLLLGGFLIGLRLMTPLLLDLKYLAVSTALQVTLFVSSFFLWIGWGEYARHIRGASYRALLCLCIALFGPLYLVLLPAVWPVLARNSGVLAALILHSVGVAVAHPTIGTSLYLIHPLLTLEIAPLCSGLEGILLFEIQLLILLVCEPPIAKKFSVPTVALFGVLYMILLNSLRIAVLFGADVYVRTHHYWSDLEPAFFSRTHAALGWVIYILGIGLFFRLLLAQLIPTNGPSFRNAIANGEERNALASGQTT